MVKIKQKKTMNLPQLIEWAWDNEIKNERFIADKQLTNIEFDDTGDVLIYGNDNKKTVKFSIEVEEEITEDTKLEKAVEVYSNEFDSWDAVFWEENSVRDILATNIGNIEDTKTETIHIVNDDGTHTLIWRDGKLVE